MTDITDIEKQHNDIILIFLLRCDQISTVEVNQKSTYNRSQIIFLLPNLLILQCLFF